MCVISTCVYTCTCTNTCAYMNMYTLGYCPLADDIDCFGTGECFALAFGVPAVLMIVSLGKLYAHTHA